MNRRLKQATLTTVLGLAALAAGCGGKKAIPPPPPTPTTNTTRPGAAKPTVSFAAEPSTIERGQSAVLRWTVSDATYISIDTFGAVQATGSRSVTPYATTTYHLTADGPGGRTAAEAVVTVNVPNPVPPPSGNENANPNLTLEQRLSQQVQDIFFGYDQYDIDDAARATLNRNATAIRSIFTDFPNASLIIEGHCDERGSAEYNLGLGDRRASATRDFLLDLGVPANKLRTVSYGKERPQCTDATEECYARNRRAHFTSATQ